MSEEPWEVKALLDSMQYAKFNVLHWHLTEDPARGFLDVSGPKASESEKFVTHFQISATPCPKISVGHYCFTSRGVFGEFEGSQCQPSATI